MILALLWDTVECYRILNSGIPNLCFFKTLRIATPHTHTNLASPFLRLPWHRCERQESLSLACQCLDKQKTTAAKRVETAWCLYPSYSTCILKTSEMDHRIKHQLHRNLNWWRRANLQSGKKDLQYSTVIYIIKQYIFIWVFHGWCIMENPMNKWMIWGVFPLFFGNTHMFFMYLCTALIYLFLDFPPFRVACEVWQIQGLRSTLHPVWRSHFGVLLQQHKAVLLEEISLP